MAVLLRVSGVGLSIEPMVRNKRGESDKCSRVVRPLGRKNFKNHGRFAHHGCVKAVIFQSFWDAILSERWGGSPLIKKERPFLLLGNDSHQAIAQRYRILLNQCAH